MIYDLHINNIDFKIHQYCIYVALVENIVLLTICENK